jgi:hypothetical protein
MEMAMDRACDCGEVEKRSDEAARLAPSSAQIRSLHIMKYVFAKRTHSQHKGIRLFHRRLG